MYAEVAWILVSSGTQVQPQVILDPDYFPDYLFVSYYYGNSKIVQKSLFIFCLQIASFLDFQNMHWYTIFNFLNYELGDLATSSC